MSDLKVKGLSTLLKAAKELDKGELTSGTLPSYIIWYTFGEHYPQYTTKRVIIECDSKQKYDTVMRKLKILVDQNAVTNLKFTKLK